MITQRDIAGRYTAFAVLAALLNFLAQSVSLAFLRGSWAFWSSVLVGTAVGFFAKYVLDKEFIFYDRRETALREANKLMLYGLTAVITTLIFWGSEWACWYIWHNSMTKYAGGTCGLTVGYILKYHLDKRFTFQPKESA